jgi:hypothetical protein
VESARDQRVEVHDGAVEIIVEWDAVRVCVRGAVSPEHLAALMGALPRTC